MAYASQVPSDAQSAVLVMYISFAPVADKVRVNGQAVGSIPGPAPFVHKGAMYMTSAGALKQFVAGPEVGIKKTINVPVVTLDRTIEHPVKAIKVDVEGGELEVLKGATQILVKYRPAIIVELLSKAAEAKVGDWLRGRGYVGQALDDRNWLFEN